MSGYLWKDKEIRYLRAHFPHKPTQEVADALGRTYRATALKARDIGVTKTPQYRKVMMWNSMTKLLESGHVHRFKKGQVPHNKGKKMPASIREKVKHTWFEKGHLPHNTRRDGAIRYQLDTSGRKYPYIRVSLSNWVPLQRYVWEKHHGPIPEGYNVIFKDGSTTNCNIDNLELLSNVELMDRNSSKNFSQPIRDLITAKRVLSRVINNRIKNENNE